MFKRNLHRVALAAMCGVASVAFVACASEPLNIPNNAQEMAAGNGHISFTATEPGDVLIEDATNSSVAYRSHLNAGDTISVDPSANQVTMNSTVVENDSLHNGDQYRILFSPATDLGQANP